MYKVGDLVRIKKREGDSYDYPLSYVDRMLDYQEVIAKVIEVEYDDEAERYKDLKYYDGDNYIYYLDVTNSEYLWSSSMLEPYVTNPHFVDLNNILR